MAVTRFRSASGVPVSPLASAEYKNNLIREGTELAWVKLDDKRAMNAKLRKAGFEARGLDEAAICWSAHEETDGFISDPELALLCKLHGLTDGRKRAALSRILVSVGRWTRDEDRGGYWINDFLKYNASHADLELRRERDRIRKRRAAGFHVESDEESDGKQSGSNLASENPVPSRPVPSPYIGTTSLLEDEKPRKKKSKTRTPNDFEITPQLKEWVSKNQFEYIDLENETQKFLDHHASKDSEFSDWSRAWQTWIRRAADFTKRPTASDPRGRLVDDGTGNLYWSKK